MSGCRHYACAECLRLEIERLQEELKKERQRSSLLEAALRKAEKEKR